MKKISKLSTLALAGLLATTGCSFGKDEEPANTYLGEYVFEYMSLETDGEKMIAYTCPASNGTSEPSGSLTPSIELNPFAICDSASKQTFEIKEDRLISTVDGKSETQYYKLNEKGEMLVAIDEKGEPAKSLQEAKMYFVYNIKIENNRIYNVLRVDENGMTTVVVYKKK